MGELLVSGRVSFFSLVTSSPKMACKKRCAEYFVPFIIHRNSLVSFISSYRHSYHLWYHLKKLIAF